MATAEFLGKKISGIFTIPSGIITTNTQTIQKIADDIPEIGVITTKSIGPEPREGNREPIITQYAPGCFMNAVGLTNPGAEEFAKHLNELKLPEDRFLLVSILGHNQDEFVSVAKTLAPFADGLELNLSCPHASGLGMAVGQDPKAVKEITAAVKQVVNIPVIPKLTPNAPNIGEIAKAAVEGGADAICAINTVGPGYYTIEGNPVLTNIKGGMSGIGILPIGLKCIKEISESVDVPILGCGGISTADDVKAYQDAGASIIGIGSALAGLTTPELKQYFKAIDSDIENNTSKATELLKPVDTSFTKYTLKENQKLAEDLSILVFNTSIDIRPGQFIFAWIPDVGEKPFSVLDNDPLTLSIRKAGCFSEKLVNLEQGAEVYFRGPYGVPIKTSSKKVMLVSGGCGLAALYHIAKESKDAEIFIGARDKDHLFYAEKASEFAKVHIATDDGSEGHKGFVTDLLKQRLEELKEDEKKNIVFFNCGPEIMINTAIEIEKKYASEINIYNSIDYLTKCGIGLCGGCVTKTGERLCVDGPFIAKNK